MRKALLLLSLVALPASVLALNYQDVTHKYTDAPFTKAESVAISVLTNAGVVEGNPDGSFGSKNAVNRAEFLKMALLSSPKIAVTASDADNCFPDVPKDAWFSSVVCLAKQRGIVKGNPDGLFHPERGVQYSEALKMMAEINEGETKPWEMHCVQPGEFVGCEVWEKLTLSPDEPWFNLYVRWAQKQKLLLPIALEFTAPLTRGQVARLAASFMAARDGELERYRAAEQGKQLASSSSSRSSSSSLQSQVSSLAASSVSSASLASSSIPSLFPATSHFLLANTTTPPLFDAVFTAPDEDGAIRFATVRFRQEMKSFSGLNLIDATGKKIGALKLAGDDTTYKIWKGDFGSGATTQLIKGVPTRFGVQAVLKNSGAISAELVDTAEFTVQVQGVQTGVSRQLIPTDAHFPYHQTAFSRIIMVSNALSTLGTLQEGTLRKVASFTFSGAVVTGYSLKLQELYFDVQSSGVALTNWKVGTGADILQASCSVNSSNTTVVDCSSIPEALQTVGGTPPRTLSLYANVSVNTGATDPFVRISLGDPGAVNAAGAIRWTDGNGRFNWIESPSPIAVGTRWTVTK